MEENPFFVIHDIEQAFHTAYNTAAKLVAILEKYDLIKEISNKEMEWHDPYIKLAESENARAKTQGFFFVALFYIIIV